MAVKLNNRDNINMKLNNKDKMVTVPGKCEIKKYIY